MYDEFEYIWIYRLAKRTLHFTSNVTKLTKLDILIYVRGMETLEFVSDHWHMIAELCNCHKVDLCYIEDEYNKETELLSRMFNFDYATGIGFPPDATISEKYPNIAMMGFHAIGSECPRCWNLHDQIGLCDRCSNVVELLENINFEYRSLEY